MGLDWNPLGKPKPGAEEEFAALFKQLGELPTRPGWFEKIRLRRRGIDREAIQKRWEEIQISPYETLGAPRVGESAEADAWARERYNEMKEPRPPEDEFMKEMQGYYVLALVPPCDGLPWYSNWPAGYCERFSFRAQFLQDCEDIVPGDTFAKCYESCLAPELAVLGQELRACAASYAKQKNLEHIEFAKDVEYQEDSSESKLHILYAATRWCEYWSSRGHGLEADW
jgi:hypothetical protein